MDREAANRALDAVNERTKNAKASIKTVTRPRLAAPGNPAQEGAYRIEVEGSMSGAELLAIAGIALTHRAPMALTQGSSVHLG